MPRCKHKKQSVLKWLEKYRSGSLLAGMKMTMRFDSCCPKGIAEKAKK